MSNEIVAVQYAHRTTTGTETYYRYPTYGESDCDLAMSYWFWVVTAPDGTITVVDTGFSEHSARTRGRSYDVHPRDALLTLGIDPRAVGTVVLSHLHWDHTGNVDLFPGARIVLDQREWDFWHGRHADKHVIAFSGPGPDADVLARAQAEGRLDLVDLDEALELAPGIVLQRLGGHTPGSAVVHVSTAEHRVIIAGDVVHFSDEVRRDRPFNVFTDLLELFDAYEYLRQFENEGGIVLAGHDPEVAGRFPAVDGAPWAVRVR
ncbi:N-acyl homoserine lactonase family protein [Cellulomonas dongxiuzhuiae]|uniref:N-acyl homoserine lactonase family protein n=1 Tax=Cellulomonas dongxiuzhuiae TaxID=2819979 RepID=A0ABX8GET3_9CELL|nr:N-acyl homoserine lactonase family protein [Cellulomonas dongxiuzhuiae]MBO3087136.1 N-acyl homoserine lactonase family protein [Cellulomonas dongxiuzhuiae]MBO3093505.1 N-acyl homoserine lactonase family protein [Cellulomonas dongxiuzhuiae]QWC14637.1 N-acyl homoserine lactonase family protein [Cellulomonas dongxiuzhuiae]